MLSRSPSKYSGSCSEAKASFSVGVRRLQLRVRASEKLLGVRGVLTPRAFICPGHPLLDATIDLTLERHRDLLKQGAILIGDNAPSDNMRALLYLEHSVQDSRVNLDGSRRVVSRQMQFVSIDRNSTVRNCGYAPYLDYRAATPEEYQLVEPLLAED